MLCASIETNSSYCNLCVCVLWIVSSTLFITRTSLQMVVYWSSGKETQIYYVEHVITFYTQFNEIRNEKGNVFSFFFDELISIHQRGLRRMLFVFVFFSRWFILCSFERQVFLITGICVNVECSNSSTFLPFDAAR